MCIDLDAKGEVGVFLFDRAVAAVGAYVPRRWTVPVGGCQAVRWV